MANSKNQDGSPKDAVDTVINDERLNQSGALDASEDANQEMTDVKFVVVTIDKGANVKTAVTVPEYEVPVLEAIYGEENISEESFDEFDGAVPESASEVHLKLLSKYKSHVDEVLSVYPSPSALAKTSGLPHDKSDSRRGGAKASVAVDNRKSSKK